MPSVEALRERVITPFSEILVRYAKGSPDILNGIRRGVAEMRDGKSRPWADIKRELRLG